MPALPVAQTAGMASQARRLLEQASQESIVIAVVSLVVGILITFVVRRAVTTFAKNHRWSPLMLGPTRTMIFWIGLLLSFGVALEQFGIHLLSSIAAMLALIAIGFVAVWSVLSNALCSVLLVVFHPFDLDDYVEFPGEEIAGRVRDLDILYTTLEGENGVLFQVPNNLFFQKTILRIPGAGRSAEARARMLAGKARARSESEKP